MRFLVVVCVAVALVEATWAYNGDPELRDLLDEVEQELDRRDLTDPSFTPTTPSPDDEGDNPDDVEDTTDDNDTGDDDDSETRIEPELIHEIRGSCGVVAAYGTHLFSDFPEGPVDDVTGTLTPENFSDEVKMFMNIAKLASKDKTVYVRGFIDSVGGKIMRHRMQCPAFKMQQLMIYMLRKGYNRVMRQDEDSLFTKLATILEPIMGPATNDYAHKAVKFTYGFLWDEVIDNIMETELHDMKILIKRLKRIVMRWLKKTTEPIPFAKWMRILKNVFKKHREAFKCATRKEVVAFHVDQAQKFKERFQDDILEKEVIVAIEELIKENFDFPPGTDPQPTITQMLDLFRSYVKGVLHYYNVFEERIKTGALDQMEPEFSKELNSEQMEFFRELMGWLYPNRPPATTT